MKFQSLQDLKHVQKQIAEAQAKAAAEAAARAAELKRIEAEKNLFIRAVGQVAVLPSSNKADIPKVPRAPVATQLQKDEAKVVQDSLSDEFDVSTLLDTDDALSFRRPSVGPEVTRKLRKGDWAIQREIDLHGLRSDEARLALTAFIREAHKYGIRCVRVVHGKGLGSPGKTPVLKSKVHSWLVQKNQVMAFVQAKPAEGGAGALVVLLTPS
ncbi:Smr/MutS family protein [Limnohabitans sp. Rim11]|uniref:Smr/MutS family protein n=1 Tax=Limnohabitans sp. Rim11 TaxID=1100719 RepID=UPI000A67309A|nr:Smr/MutS family protein [Limnohabitans sp. Rim11]